MAEPAPQSVPLQFGVAAWLYIVAMYQANGQPSEKSEPGLKRAAFMRDLETRIELASGRLLDES
jgi:hypothetical protein